MMKISFLIVLLQALGISLVIGSPGYDAFNYGGFRVRHNEVKPLKKVVDYYAKPQYAFGYEVDDYYSQLSHGRWEIRDGDVTKGQYRVLLPDGRIQIVSYVADKFGYRPTIQYINKGAHPPPPPEYANIQPPPTKLIHDVQPIIVPVTPKTEILPIVSPPALTQVLPTPVPPTVPAYAQGPLKLDVNPLAIRQVNPHRFTYRKGVPSENDLIFFKPRYYRKAKLHPSKIARKRALLYGRTLFRRDLPKPPSSPR